MALTVKRIERIKEAGRYGDGGNLFLQVSPSGGKSWLFRYEFKGRERAMGFGSIDTFNLDEARELARKARQLLKSNIDPLEARKNERDAKAIADGKVITFEQAANEYFNGHASKWGNPHYRAKFLATLKMYAHPKIGGLPVSAIDTPLVLKVIEPIWLSKNATASRVRSRIESILDWAAVRGFRSGDNPARWAGHLEEALPRIARQPKHHAALPFRVVPDFIAELNNLAGIAPRALEFLILCASRSGEVVGARWSEVTLDAVPVMTRDAEGRETTVTGPVWIIPASRMKEGVQHRVPLSDRAVAILKNIEREKGNDFVFIGSRKGKPLGNNELLKLIWAMGSKTPAYDVTIHGFRSSFRDWAGEVTSYPADVCEVALAHKIGGKVREAYQRHDLFDKRRLLMAEWARFVGTPKGDASVILIRKRRGR
jgi:integrase